MWVRQIFCKRIRPLNSILFSCCPLDKHSINLSYRKPVFCVASLGCVYLPSSWWPQHSPCVIGVKEGLSQILARGSPGRLSAPFGFLRANLFARKAWSEFVCLAKGSAVCMSSQDGEEKKNEKKAFISDRTPSQNSRLASLADTTQQL